MNVARESNGVGSLFQVGRLAVDREPGLFMARSRSLTGLLNF